MVSKTRAQRQKNKAKLAGNNGVMPQVVPSEKKSIHLKKTRPNMKGKDKIRLGMTSADIYEGFEDRKGVLWKCQTCGKVSRVVGYCMQCTTGVKAKEHSGMMMSRDAVHTVKAKQQAKAVAAKKAPLASAKKAKSESGKKLRFKKKH